MELVGLGWVFLLLLLSISAKFAALKMSHSPPRVQSNPIPEADPCHCSLSLFRQMNGGRKEGTMGEFIIR
jgi:hypothetical protein